MSRLEKWLVFLCSGLAPLATLRVAGVNLGVFDLTALALLAVQVVRRGTLPAIGWVYWAGALVVIGGLASGVGAPRPGLVLEQVLQWIFIFLVVVPAIVVAGRDRASAPWLFAGVTAGMLFLVGFAVVEVYSGQGTYVAGRYAGFHGSPQLMAFTVSSFLPYLVLAPTVIGGSGRVMAVASRLGLMTVAAALAWLTFMTASRTGLIASVAAIGTIVMLKQLEALGQGIVPFLGRGLLVAMYLLVLGGALGLIVVALTPEALDVLARRLSLSVNASPDVLGSRMRIYQEAIAQLDVPTFLSGVGLANYPFESEYTLRPHNLVLLAVWEGGILFLSGLVLSIGVFLRLVLASVGEWWSHDQTYRDMATAATAGFVAFLVIAMFNTQSVHRMYWFNYAIALGSLTAMRSPSR